MGRKHDVVKLKNAAMKKELATALLNFPDGAEWSSLWIESVEGHDTAQSWRAADRNRRASSGARATFTAVVQRSGSGNQGAPTASERSTGTAPLLITLSASELTELVRRHVEAALKDR